MKIRMLVQCWIPMEGASQSGPIVGYAPHRTRWFTFEVDDPGRVEQTVERAVRMIGRRDDRDKLLTKAPRLSASGLRIVRTVHGAFALDLAEVAISSRVKLIVTQLDIVD